MLVVDHIGALYTMDGSGPHGLGVVRDAVIVAEGERVAYAGPAAGAPPRAADAVVIDAGGRAVTPGLVDCHTHAIFAGGRADEFAMRARGETYAAIMAAGGGIRSTMRAVRAASVDDLVEQTAPRLRAMLRRGVTTVEVKSGYGLSVEHELKMLFAARALAERQPIAVVPTLLAAHAVPPEHEGNADAWIDEIVRDLLPEVARQGLATGCDVFVEQGAFSVEHGRRLLRRALDLGLSARVHAEQLSRQGGARLAAEIGARSAGHLEHATPEDIEALAGAGVVAEVLATAQVFLGLSQRIPGRALCDAGVDVAVGTDFNPGSAMSSDLPLAAGLAVTQCGLTVEEALRGVTVNGAKAVGLDDRGVLAAGRRADLVVLSSDSAVDLVYRWADPPVRVVVAGGRVAHEAREPA